MLNSTSKVHELFRELTELGGSNEIYSMLRDTFDIISGKSKISDYFNTIEKQLTYLEKWYTDKQIAKFYNILKKIDITDYNMPVCSKYEPREVIDLSKEEDIDSDYPRDKEKIYKAWLLGYLTAKLFN